MESRPGTNVLISKLGGQIGKTQEEKKKERRAENAESFKFKLFPFAAHLSPSTLQISRFGKRNLTIRLPPKRLFPSPATISAAALLIASSFSRWFSATSSSILLRFLPFFSSGVENGSSHRRWQQQGERSSDVLVRLFQIRPRACTSSVEMQQVGQTEKTSRRHHPSPRASLPTRCRRVQRRLFDRPGSGFKRRGCCVLPQTWRRCSQTGEPGEN